MFYLVTGGVGTGKTLFTLQWVRKLQEETGRPVCYCLDGKGETVLRLKGPALDFGWREIDFVTWENEADGTIFILDECHELLPVRGLSKGQPPEHIQNLARHRHRGFDFFLITQHPKNLDAFVRRLIADPGWHRHLKRRNGGKTVAQLQWPNVFEKCESNTAGKTATVTDVRYPIEVFEWYESASIHTAKYRIPKQMFIIVPALFLVPLSIWYAIHFFTSGNGISGGAKVEPGLLDSAKSFGVPGISSASSEGRVMTRQEYIDSLKPRIEALAWTAPRYDPITEPVKAPFPAACLLQLEKEKDCKCWTQEATPLAVPFETCRDIAQNGVFLDWQTGGYSGSAASSGSLMPAIPAASAGSRPIS